MNVFDLFAKLSLDSSEYEKGLSDAKNEAESAGSKIGGGLMSAAKVGVAAIGAASVATVKFGKDAVATGMSFDQSMSQVAATMGKTMDEMANETGTALVRLDGETKEFNGTLRDFAQYMGANTAFTASQAADALNYMALAGYNTQESMDMLPNVLNLAAAGSMDLARASDMVTDTQTAFGITAERTTQMVDEMAKAASTGNTSVEQLGDAFLVVGGLAQELNGGMVTLADGTTAEVDGVQELEIALTAMANAGVKGSEAGTHMRNMLLKLSDPTDAGASSLEALGVAIFDAEGNMRSLKDIFSDMSNAMDGDVLPSFEKFYDKWKDVNEEELLKKFKDAPEDFDFLGVSIVDAEGHLRDFETVYKEAQDTFAGGISQEAKIQSLANMFNVRDLAAVEAVLGSMTGDWDEIGEAILDSKDAASEMAETQLDNLAGDVTKLKSAFEGFQIAISDSLTGGLREFVQFGTNALSRMTEAFKSGGMEGLMTELGAILSDGLNMLIQNLPEIVNAGLEILKALGKGILDNLDVLLDVGMTIVTELLKGITVAIPALLTGLAEALPTIIQGLMNAAIEIMNSLAELLPELIPQLITALVEAFITFISNVDAFVQAALSIITALVDGIIAALPILIEALPVIVNAIVEAIVNNLPLILDAAINIIGAIIEGILGNLGPLVSAGIQIIVSLIGGIMNAIPDILAAIAELMIEIVTSILKSLPELIDAGFQIMGAFIKGIVDMLGNVIEAVISIIDAVISVLGKAVVSLVEIGRDWVEGIGKGIKSLDDRAKQWGRDLIANFLNGIKSRINDIIRTCKDIGAAIKKYLGFSEPELGPLSDFHTYAPDMMKLFAKGIADNENLITDQIDKSFDFGDDIVSDADTSVHASYDDSASSNGGAIQEVIALLQKIANKELAVSPAGLLTIVREQNDIYKTANGGASAL